MYMYVLPCVRACVVCLCVRVSVYYDTLVCLLVFSLSFLLAFVCSLLLHTLSLPLFLSWSFRTQPHTRAHTFFPPAFLSLPILRYLTFRVRSPLSIYTPIQSRVFLLRNWTLFRIRKPCEIERCARSPFVRSRVPNCLASTLFCVPSRTPIVTSTL